MNASESIIEIGLTRSRLTATQIFLKEVNRIMNTKYKKEKRAHTVERAHMVNKQDWAYGVFYGSTVMYTSYLHYAPEIGYYGCVKDNHGNLILNTEAYCLASTVRELIGEFIYQINRGWQR
jgi:hypothetical protein